VTERLDLQRLPSKYHARKNSRWYRRGYSVIPHHVWGDEAVPVGPPVPAPDPNGPTLTITPNPMPNVGIITLTMSDWVYPDGQMYFGYLDGVETLTGTIGRGTAQTALIGPNTPGPHEVFLVLVNSADPGDTTAARTSSTAEELEVLAP
jgi:hypothetical protein